MAPEVLNSHPDHYSGDRVNQSPKVDVWSLFVTIAYTRSVCNYQSRSLGSKGEILAAARDAAADKSMAALKDMAVEDPSKRATAKEMLIAMFNARGITVQNVGSSMQRDNYQLHRELESARQLRRSPRNHDSKRINYFTGRSRASLALTPYNGDCHIFPQRY